MSKQLKHASVLVTILLWYAHLQKITIPLKVTVRDRSTLMTSSGGNRFFLVWVRQTEYIKAKKRKEYSPNDVSGHAMASSPWVILSHLHITINHKTLDSPSTWLDAHEAKMSMHFFNMLSCFCGLVWHQFFSTHFFPEYTGTNPANLAPIVKFPIYSIATTNISSAS